MSDTNCPFCGCEIAPFREKKDVIRYSCRNPLVPNSAPRGPLCRELEAHNHTKRERDEAREEANKPSGAYEDATNYYARIIELINERDKALEELRKLKIILDVIKNETL